MSTLYYAKYVHIAQTQIWIPIQTQILISPIIPILGWISVTRLGLELVSGNVNKPFQYVLHFDVTSLILLPLDFIWMVILMAKTKIVMGSNLSTFWIKLFRVPWTNLAPELIPKQYEIALGYSVFTSLPGCKGIS